MLTEYQDRIITFDSNNNLVVMDITVVKRDNEEISRTPTKITSVPKEIGPGSPDYYDEAERLSRMVAAIGEQKAAAVLVLWGT